MLCRRGGGQFFLAIWGILKMMFGGLVCAVKSLAVGAQGNKKCSVQ